MAADAKATGDAIHNLQGLVGTPLVAATAASMTNTDKIYVYTGSETGYTNGNWYYYDGTAWTSGGVYNSVAMNMDTVPTLGSSNVVTSGGIKAALDLMDDDISSLNEDITNINEEVSQLPGLKNSTSTDPDLDISDPYGNVALRLEGGHIKTKNFDSSTLASSLSILSSSVAGKISTQQSASDAGKALVIGSDGTVAPAPVAVDIEVDPTLSQEGEAADAKAVGDAIAAIPTGSSNIVSTEAESDLDISDAFGNVITRFVGGGAVTKQFKGYKYITYAVHGSYTVGQALTVTLNRAFKKGDRVVLHMERNAMPWDSGGRVSYYAGDVEITDTSWRGDCAYLEYQIPKDVAFISATYPNNGLYESTEFTFEVSLLGEISITPTVVTIKKDGSGDFTNLKECLADIGYKANDVLNPYRIEIYPGTYDVLEDYTAEEIADIFYGEISINQYSQTSFVGPKLLNGMSLVGVGNPQDIVLTAWLDPAPTDDLSKRKRGQISTLNLQGSGSIENLTLIAQNMRYCVHDDFSAPLGKPNKRLVKNCIFRGYNIAYGPHTTYGAGMPQGGQDFLFIGCDFGEDAGVHTQPTMYYRPEIHLIDCKGHSFRIGDNETVDPIEEYTVYRLDNCNFLDIRHNMAGNAPHAKFRGTGGSSPFYQFDPQMEYNTGEITIVPLDVLGTALTVGTCVEMYNDNGSGPRFRAITALDNFAGIVVFVDDDDNTYIQTRGYIRTDRLGLSNFALNDKIGLSGTACAVVSSASDAFGKIAYIDNPGQGYVKIGGNLNV